MQRIIGFISSFPKRSFVFRGPTLIFVGLGLLFTLLSVPPAWEYSNSAGFCGTTCHTMPPEYSTYQASPHARVLCVDCHIGRDLMAVQFQRKIGHTRLVVATLLDTYEYPIRIGEMRPARETCEHCHFPEKFSDDSVRILNRSENNRTNDPYQIYLLMHTGGGQEREGLGYGIHWHVQNKVSFIALDNESQEIPWIRVEREDGTVTEYNALNSPVDTAHLSQYEIQEMDCTTCHNRISHLLASPERAIDDALATEKISREIPFIRVRGVELLAEEYTSFGEADAALESLEQYYGEYYPEFYATGSDQVQEAIAELKELYRASNFPDQELTWQTHPNNIGHQESAGCFRCHDGQHFATSGETAGEAIRLECNLCHSIPQVVRPTDIEPKLPLATGNEPASHLDSTWISQHHNAFDASCANCHTTINAGGIDNQSFCANSACHANNWKYAGFDAPGLAMLLGLYQVQAVPLLEDFTGDPTYADLQPLFVQQCGGCHGPVPSKGLKVVEYATLMSGSESGAVIVPGHPEESRMIEVLYEGHFARLTRHQMELLERWITNNAPEQ